jgi:hypothetical protein
MPMKKKIAIKKITLDEPTIKIIIVSILGIVFVGIIFLLSTSYYYSHKKSSSIPNRFPVTENSFESNISEFEKNNGSAESPFKPIEGNPDEIFGKPSEVPVGTE